MSDHLPDEDGRPRPEDLLRDRDYTLAEATLAELDLTLADIHDLHARVRPLGMSQSQYEHFRGELLHALARDGITDADVRMQGSSVKVYSSPAKTMPFSDAYPDSVDRAALHEEMRRDRRTLPSAIDLDEATARLREVWPTRPLPRRRPFDALFVCRVHADRSDYDVQVSSDQMIEVVRAEVRRIGVDPDRISVTDATYAFIRKCYTEEYFLYVTQWCMRQSQFLGRSVSWALFPGHGPQRFEPVELSSHFRDSDWIIDRPTGAPVENGERQHTVPTHDAVRVDR